MSAAPRRAAKVSTIFTGNPSNATSDDPTSRPESQAPRPNGTDRPLPDIDDPARS